jgi:hypothetical protein
MAEITKEYLEARKTELAAQKEQHLSKANACNGAIQVVDAMLSELARTEEAPPVN